jgi:hypothetical protein
MLSSLEEKKIVEGKKKWKVRGRKGSLYRRVEGARLRGSEGVAELPAKHPCRFITFSPVVDGE